MHRSGHLANSYTLECVLLLHCCIEDEKAECTFKKTFFVNSPFHSSWKVTKILHETEAKTDLAQLEKWE